MVQRAVESKPLTGPDAGFGPNPEASTGHRWLPQLQVAGNGNVVWNVDGRLVGWALLGCGEVLFIAAAVAVVVKVAVVVGGVDVGVQEMVVVVVWVGRGGWGQGGHADDAVFGVIFWAVGATSAAGHQTGKIGLCVVHAVYLFSVIWEGNTNEEGINKQGEIVKLYTVSTLNWAQNDPLNVCYQIPLQYKPLRHSLASTNLEK